MKYNILIKYGNVNKNLWIYYTVTETNPDTNESATVIYETEDLTELETTLLDLYNKYPVSDVKAVSDVSATLDITFT